MTQSARTEQKIKALIAAYGPFAADIIGAGRISPSQIDDLYGRAAPRQQAILTAMRAGVPYSRASKGSTGEFDTKNWKKVRKRTAAVRGHVLTTMASIACQSRTEVIRDEEAAKLIGMVEQLCELAFELTRRVLDRELIEGDGSTRKPAPAELVVGDTVSFTRLHQSLATANSKLRKTVRDVPQMERQLGGRQTVSDAACVLIDVARIIHAAPLLIASLESRDCSATAADTESLKHVLSIVGVEYADVLSNVPLSETPTRRIATHRKPDADALVAAWIAETHLFPGETCRVEFVSRGADLMGRDFDCVVDVGRIFDSGRLWFDHKPPAFADRHETCAAKLVWQHAQENGRDLDYLRDIIELVHDGDAATRRSGSERYARSRQTGLHALIRHAGAHSHGDQMLYQVVKLCLGSLSDHSTSPWACPRS